MKKLLQGAAGLIGLLALWQLVIISGKYNIALFPAPAQVFVGWLDLIENGTMFEHIRISMIRFAAGYLSAAVLGIGLGLIFGWFGNLWNFFNPIIQVSRPISPMAWIPFIVLWFGIGDIPAIVIIFIAAFYPILLSSVAAVGRADRIYINVARNFALTKTEILIKVVFPASFPQISTGLHQAIGTAWVFLVAGEMVGAQSGLGFLIIDSRNNLRADLLLAAILTIGAIGLLLDTLIRMLEKQVYAYWGA
ncbi:MAG: ABC transporter permease [Burkholderiales bacterium]|jgi:NitT/TauT family transport system permease protein|nr:ABC transporter permease [Burkholderiales bacterium]